jgi:hypothetical protein
MAVSAEAVDFGGSLPADPFLQLAANDATSTAPPYPSGVSAAGFTPNGTASARLTWSASGARNAY